MCMRKLKTHKIFCWIIGAPYLFVSPETGLWNDHGDRSCRLIACVGEEGRGRVLQLYAFSQRLDGMVDGQAQVLIAF